MSENSRGLPESSPMIMPLLTLYMPLVPREQMCYINDLMEALLFVEDGITCNDVFKRHISSLRMIVPFMYQKNEPDSMTSMIVGV